MKSQLLRSFSVLAMIGAVAFGTYMWKHLPSVDAAPVAASSNPVAPRQSALRQSALRQSALRQSAALQAHKAPVLKVNWIQSAADLPPAIEPHLDVLPLQPGELAPDFTLRDQGGKIHRLANLRGKSVVPSFYPQDYTSACFVSASSLSVEQPRILARGAVVFGVSVQSWASKKSFARDFGIQIPLLADESKDVARAYRVLSGDGRAARVTFVIGPDGHILDTDQSVDAAHHGRDVLVALFSEAFLKIAARKFAAKSHREQSHCGHEELKILRALCFAP